MSTATITTDSTLPVSAAIILGVDLDPDRVAQWKVTEEGRAFTRLERLLEDPESQRSASELRSDLRLAGDLFSRQARAKARRRLGELHAEEAQLHAKRRQRAEEKKARQLANRKLRALENQQLARAAGAGTKKQ